MAMIGPDDASRIEEIDLQQVFGSEFKVDWRVKGVAQWMRRFNLPVARLVDGSEQYSTCLDAPPFVDIQQYCLPGGGAHAHPYIRLFFHIPTCVSLYPHPGSVVSCHSERSEE